MTPNKKSRAERAAEGRGFGCMQIKYFVVGYTAAEERVEKVIKAARSVFTLEHVNRTTYSPTALAHYNKAMAELGEALKAWEDGK